MMKITTKIAMEIAQHEGLVRQAYKDSVGVWTWGIGVTGNSGHKVDLYIGKPQTLAKVLEVYIWLLETKYLPSVEEAFFGKDLTEEQLGAALSFHWNTGAIKKATWVKQFMAGQMTASRQSFMNYRKPPEIIPRREAERDLFFHGVWSSKGTVNEYTKVSASGNIDWRSGKPVKVKSALDKLLTPEGAGFIGMIMKTILSLLGKK